MDERRIVDTPFFLWLLVEDLNAGSRIIDTFVVVVVVVVVVQFLLFSYAFLSVDCFLVLGSRVVVVDYMDQ